MVMELCTIKLVYTAKKRNVNVIFTCITTKKLIQASTVNTYGGVVWTLGMPSMGVCC